MNVPSFLPKQRGAPARQRPYRPVLECLEDRCLLSRGFAQASARAEADLQETDRQSLADSYRRRALKAVHQTLAMLPPEERSSFWRDKILPDAALTPIRNDADFKRLQEEYGHR